MQLGCVTGHRFDANRRGYLNTVDPARGIVGDPRELLDARARFLGAGHFTPIADAVVAALPATGPLSVIDSGSGTGYYLAHLLAHSPAVGEALAVDASVTAVSMSVAATGASGLVADVWRAIAVRSGRADTILCLFSPRNAAEFHRILRPGGRLVVVSPTARHLEELRAAGLVIGIQESKRDRLDETLSADFELEGRSLVEFELELDRSAVADLTTMGPSGHHELSGHWAGSSVTASVDLSVFSARSARGSTRTASRSR